jgi:hypothetical protein
VGCGFVISYIFCGEEPAKAAAIHEVISVYICEDSIDIIIAEMGKCVHRNLAVLLIECIEVIVPRLQNFLLFLIQSCNSFLSVTRSLIPASAGPVNRLLMA